MIICMPVTIAGQVGGGWGRASRVAVVRAAGDRVADWHELDVRWDELHDQGTSGSHHARVVRFLREHQVDTVVAGHMGDGMRQTLDKLGVRVVLGATGDAQAAIAAVINEDSSVTGG